MIPTHVMVGYEVIPGESIETRLITLEEFAKLFTPVVEPYERPELQVAAQRQSKSHE